MPARRFPPLGPSRKRLPALSCARPHRVGAPAQPIHSSRFGNDNSDQFECRVPGDKSDRNDAVGIAPIMQTGWFKEVRVKDLDCPRIWFSRSRLIFTGNARLVMADSSCDISSILL
jgi:hypothetical protein